jgi:Zn finger protein HypA/HybF involved in hydrogenase expression
MYHTICECPNCNNDVEVETYRWNTKTVCPHCDIDLLVDFDFYCDDEYNEFDVYQLKILPKDHYFLEVVKSVKA